MSCRCGNPASCDSNQYISPPQLLILSFRPEVPLITFTQIDKSLQVLTTSSSPHSLFPIITHLPAPAPNQPILTCCRSLQSLSSMDRAGHLKINDSFQNVIPENPQKVAIAPPDGHHADFQTCAVPVHPTPVISFPEPKHRCRTYPCPICGGAGDSDNQQLDINISKVDNIHQNQQLQQPLPQGTVHLENVSATSLRHPTPMISFPEPQHRCRTLPCPVCGAGYAMKMSYEQLINPKQLLLPLNLHQEGTDHSQGLNSSAPVHPPTPISFPEPQHRCRTFPCPVCGEAGDDQHQLINNSSLSMMNQQLKTSDLSLNHFQATLIQCCS